MQALEIIPAWVAPDKTYWTDSDSCFRIYTSSVIGCTGDNKSRRPFKGQILGTLSRVSIQLVAARLLEYALKTKQYRS